MRRDLRCCWRVRPWRRIAPLPHSTAPTKHCSHSSARRGDSQACRPLLIKTGDAGCEARRERSVGRWWRLWERRYAARLAVLLVSAVVAAHSTAPTQHRSHEALLPCCYQSRRIPCVSPTNKEGGDVGCEAMVSW